MASPITLYTYWRSSCSYRVRIALALKGLPYVSIPVHLLSDGGQQHAPAYTALNPMHEVPTLQVDGCTLTQSMAIIEYLDETRPQPPLLPATPTGRFAVREIVCVVTQDMQPVCNLRLLNRVAELAVPEGGANPPADPGEAPPPSLASRRAAVKTAWAVRCLGAGFDALEVLLARHAGTCCVGDEVTLADVVLVPQVYNGARFGLDMAGRWPTVARVAAHLKSLPAFAAADPAAQPDAEK